jgi:7-cyano-7-deazaguanine synthase
MKNTLLILSGGLDSTSALYIHKNYISLAVSFNYGSNHNSREIEMAAYNCEKLGIEHKIIDLKEVFKGMKSSLLGTEAVPYGHYEDETMKSTVVPFRNGIMLSIATAIAEDNNLGSVMIGSHKGDNAVYPDCRPEFNAGIRAAMRMGTYNNIDLVAPFETITKKELAQKGIEAGMNPDFTYSCYEGGEIHCGKCSTCRERDWALGLREEA